MSRVNVDAVAFTDLRFARLARRLGLADADHAIGKMLRLWWACTERETYSLPAIEVAIVFDSDEQTITEVLRDCELADVLDGGLLRIHGTKGRIEWLAKLRKASRKGGRATKAKWQARGLANGIADRGPEEGPPTPTPAPAPALDHTSPNSASSSSPVEKNKKAPDWTYRAADVLRDHVLRRQPSNALSRKPWTNGRGPRALRQQWAQTFDRMARKDGRSQRDIRTAIDWLFGTENLFVVMSADSLRKKFDNVRAAMARPENPRHGQLTPRPGKDLAPK